MRDATVCSIVASQEFPLGLLHMQDGNVCHIIYYSQLPFITFSFSSPLPPLLLLLR